MTVSSGSLRHFENFASKYIQPRAIDVWLPDGYTDKEKYAVLYMQDGQMLFDAHITWNQQEWQVDETAGRLIAESQTKKFIVVAIWNAGTKRRSEYFPQKPFESLAQNQRDSLYSIKSGTKLLFDGAVYSDNYLKFIVKELKPFIDHTFSVKTHKEDTFIAGSSMGGLISLYAMCEYPDVFGGAACLSTHWTGTFEQNQIIPKAFLTYLSRNLPSGMTHKIYFDLGDQTLDALYGTHQKQVDLVLMAKGYGESNWTTRVFPDEDHSEKAWAKRLDSPLVFLLGGPSVKK